MFYKYKNFVIHKYENFVTLAAFEPDAHLCELNALPPVVVPPVAVVFV